MRYFNETLTQQFINLKVVQENIFIEGSMNKGIVVLSWLDL